MMKLSFRIILCLAAGVFLLGWNVYLTMEQISSFARLPPHQQSTSSASFHAITGGSLVHRDAMTVKEKNNASATAFLSSKQSPAAIQSWATPMLQGLDPVYLHLHEEAVRRSNVDYESSHTRGNVGIVIGPTDGDFLSHTLLALRSARRMRNMLVDKTIRIALLTSAEHVQILNTQCGDSLLLSLNASFSETCRLWANGSLLDDLIVMPDNEFQHNDNFTRPLDTPSKYWLKSLASYKHAPYKLSLVLDSDAFTCPGFEHLFALQNPQTQNLWQLPNQALTDFAAGIDQYAFGTGNNKHLIPGDPKLFGDYFDFAERNTGTMLFSFHRQLTHTFTHFVPLVSEYVWNYKASAEHSIVNDQCPFRLALYLFKRFHPDFVDQQIPQHASCRTYPHHPYAGTHSAKSRMMPFLADGTECNDCMCTPCLITHFSTDYPVPVQGRMGYEEDFQLLPPYQRPE